MIDIHVCIWLIYVYDWYIYMIDICCKIGFKFTYTYLGAFNDIKVQICEQKTRKSLKWCTVPDSTFLKWQKDLCLWDTSYYCVSMMREWPGLIIIIGEKGRFSGGSQVRLASPPPHDRKVVCRSIDNDRVVGWPDLIISQRKIHREEGRKKVRKVGSCHQVCRRMYEKFCPCYCTLHLLVPPKVVC